MLFLAKWSEIRFSRPSNVPSSIDTISFPCNWISFTFLRPSNKPLSKLRSLFNFSIIFSRLLRSLKTPTGIDINGVEEISTCLRDTKPSKAPGSIDEAAVFMNSTFSSWGLLAKAALGIVFSLLPTKKTSVTPALSVGGISVVDELKTCWFSLRQLGSLSHSGSDHTNNKDRKRMAISPLVILIHYEKKNN